MNCCLYRNPICRDLTRVPEPDKPGGRSQSELGHDPGQANREREVPRHRTPREWEGVGG